MKARKANAIEALAISVKSSFPQLDCQSSTRVAADDAEDIRRYARTCPSQQILMSPTFKKEFEAKNMN